MSTDQIIPEADGTEETTNTLDAQEQIHDSARVAREQGITVEQYLTVASAVAREVRAEILAKILDRRDGFLGSPNLERAWIAGWHAAADDIAHTIATAQS